MAIRRRDDSTADATEGSNAGLKQRLASIKKQISSVETDIRDLSKAVKRPDRADALNRIRAVSEQQERELAEASAQAAAAPAVASRPTPQAAVSEAPPAATRAAAGRPLSSEGKDQRFASYFTAGSLHSVQPLRQERRILRNRAIVMVIVAAALLYLVIHLLR
jgi:hypothetical protein